MASRAATCNRALMALDFNRKQFMHRSPLILACQVCDDAFQQGQGPPLGPGEVVGPECAARLNSLANLHDVKRPRLGHLLLFGDVEGASFAPASKGACPVALGGLDLAINAFIFTRTFLPWPL